MKKYHIENNGCDDTTIFDIELTSDEVKTIIRVFEENNKNADYGCRPNIYIYEYKEDVKYYWVEKPLNKSYGELETKEVEE